MPSIKSTLNVLIVTGTEKGVSAISDMLDKSAFSAVSSAFSGSEARRMLMRYDYDLVIINAPLSDEFGHDLAITITEKYSASVIMLVKSQLFDNVSSKIENYGIFTVARPVDRHLFHQVTRLVVANASRLERYRKESDKLKTRLDELRIVCQAKCLLVEYLRMNETQAHRYIEKQAMDNRTTKLSVAEEIISNYSPEL